MAHARDGDRQERARLIAGHLAPGLAILNGAASAVLQDLAPVGEPARARQQAVRDLDARLSAAGAQSKLDALWDQYARPVTADTGGGTSRDGAVQAGRLRTALYSPAWVGLVLVLGTTAVYALLGGSWARTMAVRAEVLQGFAVIGLTVLPAFLYLRFARFRLDPVCDEYVHNLHRLGVDRPRDLPEPPRASEAWERWANDGGLLRAAQGENVYERKFRTQYGRWPKVAERQDGAARGARGTSPTRGAWYADSLGNLTVVYACTAVIGAGWATVIWTLGSSVEPAGPPMADALRFAFLGAYFYVISTLLRRFFQNDLRPGAYLAAIVRVVSVLVLVAAVHEALRWLGAPLPLECAVAFFIGVFPSVGVQLIRKTTSTLTGKVRGGIEPPWPLRQLDGMDIWTESRLLEVGIEDVQHLATANVVDALLATRIPAQRMVDWVDQALLLIHAGLPGPRQDNLATGATYGDLRRLGIRSASDLSSFSASLDARRLNHWWASNSSLTAPLTVAEDGGPSLLCRVAIIDIALANDPNLRLVRNWQDYEQPRTRTDARRPLR